MNITVSRKAQMQDRYRVFLQMVGAFYGFSLSDKELDIMNAIYWEAGGQINKDVRKKVCEALGMTDYNLNNYLMKLRKKKLVTEQGISEKLVVNIGPADRVFSLTFAIES